MSSVKDRLIPTLLLVCTYEWVLIKEPPSLSIKMSWLFDRHSARVRPRLLLLVLRDTPFLLRTLLKADPAAAEPLVGREGRHNHAQ